MSLVDLLVRPVAYHPALAKMLGSVPAAVMLSQAIYWQKRVPEKRPVGCPGPEWWHHSIDEWEIETALTRYEQATARKILIKELFWNELRKGVPARLWFMIDFVELEKSIKYHQFAGMQQTRLLDRHKLDCCDTTNKFAVVQQTLAEITPENTTETTTSNQVEVFDLEEHLSLIKTFDIPADVKNQNGYLYAIRQRIKKDGPSCDDLEQFNLLMQKNIARQNQQAKAKQTELERQLIEKERDDPVKQQNALKIIQKLAGGNY